MKNKYGGTKKDEISNNITTSKRKPNKVEVDRRKEICNIIFHKHLNFNSIYHYSRFTDKRLSK